MSEEETTRYENPLIAPSPGVLQLHFALLGTVNGLVAVSSFILIVSLLRSKKVRSSSFNLYVLFMAIPDFVASFLCLVSCSLGAVYSEYYSDWMCQFQGFYLAATFAANAWLNAVIVHEVYKLIRFSNERRRYFPPTRQQVFCRVAVVYTYGIIFGLMASYVPGLPIKPAPFYGLVCLPMVYDLASTLYFYLVFVPGVMVLPMMYSAGVMIYVLKKGLLPKTGRNRVISVYLLRLVALYFLFWMPCLLLKVIGNFTKIDPWYPWAGSVLSHTQGIFSVLCAVFTSDAIRHEVLMVLQCKFHDPPLRDGRHSKITRFHETQISGSARTHHPSVPVGNGKDNNGESTETCSGSEGLEESHREVDPEEEKADLEAGEQQQ